MIDLETVATAAVTALLVTFPFNYLAKARLEVRTHRKIEMVRRREEFVATLISIGFSASILTEGVPDDLDAAAREHFLSEQERHYARARTACRDLFDNAGRYISAYPSKHVTTFLVDGIATLYGTVRSTRDRRRQAEIVKDLAGPLIEVAGANRLWRLPATVRAKLRAERLIAEVQRPPTEDAEEEEPARQTLADDRPVD